MVRNSNPPYPISGIPDVPPTGGGGISVFDSPGALAINQARMAHLDSLQLPLAGKRVLDAGCGVGHLARFFVDRGCQVTCVDARQENVDSLRSRYPDLDAHTVNVEADSLISLGRFDIVFCYGLLYHLENPVAALRNFEQVCDGILLLETVVSDHVEPVLRLIDEPAETPNQALGGLAGRPSPAFVAMALTRVGYRYVYAPKLPPDHPDFQFAWGNNLEFSRDGHLLRCIFVGSHQPLDNSALSLLLEGPPTNARHFLAPFDVNRAPWHNETEATTKKESSLTRFSPAAAYWNQRVTLAGARDRILSLSQAVNQRSDLWPYQWAQLMAAAMDYEPDIILELGRGKGNSTCAFTEASNLKKGSRVLSLCLSDSFERETVPQLRKIVPESWFAPLEALRADILDFDYAAALSGAKRVLIFWDAHGFEIAECVLGAILPVVAQVEHLVLMHDLSDARYNSEEQLEYGGHGLWKGNDWSGPRVKLGIIDSAVEQSVAALDFTTRNHITLDSADHSFRTSLTPAQQTEMQSLLGDLFETQGHWFYFSLNERPGPYRFPRYTRRRAPAQGRKARF